MHICDMFDKVPVMASRGLVKSLIKFVIKSILFMSFMSSVSFMEFMGIDWVLALKEWHKISGYKLKTS